MAKYTKQKHGTVNSIFLQEENELIAKMEKAQQSTTNSKILGDNGEIGIKNFLNRYLPSCFRAVGGHFVAPDGEMSPEIDVMLVDPQYPYLSQNENGSVVAMMHSVLSTIEVKLNLKGKEIKKIRKDTSTIQRFSHKVFPGGSWSKIFQYGIAYKTGFRLETVKKNFFVGYEENPPYTFLYILRSLLKDVPEEEQYIGASVWLEDLKDPEILLTVAPLSDFYYQLIQDAYYILDSRDPRVAQRDHSEGQKAQEQTSSCLRATFIMLSPGYKTVLRAKLAHIVLKAGQGFNTCPACPREFLAPFLHSHDSFFRPTRRQFVEH